MRKYQAKVTYELIEDGDTAPLLDAPSAVEYVRDAIAVDPVREQHWIITLGPDGTPIARHLVALGPAEGCMVHPGDMCRAAMMDHASSFVYIHNHPMVDVAEPSISDRQAAQIIVLAAIQARVAMYDMIVMTSPKRDGSVRHYSWRENGWPEVCVGRGLRYRTGPEEQYRHAIPRACQPTSPLPPAGHQQVSTALAQKLMKQMAQLTPAHPITIGPP